MDEQSSRPREEESSYAAPSTQSELFSGWLQRSQAESYWHHVDDEEEDEEDSTTATTHDTFSARWRSMFRRMSHKLDSMFWPVTDTQVPVLQAHGDSIAGPNRSKIDEITLDYEDMYRIPELPTTGLTETQQTPYEVTDLPQATEPRAQEAAVQLPEQQTVPPAERTPPPLEAPPIPLPFVAEVQRMPESPVIVPEVTAPDPSATIEHVPVAPDQRWWPAAAPVVQERTILQPQEAPKSQTDRQLQELKLQTAYNMESQQKLERIIAQERQTPRIEPIVTPRHAFEQQYRAAEAPYTAPAQAERQAFAPNAVPNTDSLAEQHVKPEVVLESVAVAAEQNTAVERVYERRQEVRDEPAVAPSAAVAGAPSVATILAAQQAQQASFEHSITTVAPPIQPQQPFASTHYVPRPQQSTQSYSQYEQQDMYRQAARTGFWVALVVIVGAVVFYFVR